MNKLTAHKNDIILLLILAIAGLCVTGGYRLLHRTTGDTVTITVDGRTYRTLPLSVDTTLDIPGADGGTNHLEIKNGTPPLQRLTARINSVYIRLRSATTEKVWSVFLIR